MTCASPSLNPAYLAGSSLASMHVRMANRRAGGSARSDFLPNPAADFALAERTSSSTDDIGSPGSSVGWGGGEKKPRTGARGIREKQSQSLRRGNTGRIAGDPRPTAD